MKKCIKKRSVDMHYVVSFFIDSQLVLHNWLPLPVGATIHFSLNFNERNVTSASERDIQNWRYIVGCTSYDCLHITVKLRFNPCTVIHMKIEIFLP